MTALITRCALAILSPISSSMVVTSALDGVILHWELANGHGIFDDLRSPFNKPDAHNSVYKIFGNIKEL